MSNDYLSDFSLRCGSWTSSFLSLCKAVVMYILLPLAIISLLNGIGPRLSEAVGSQMDFNAIILEFSVYLDRYIVYAIPLVFLSIGIGYYPAGNYARIPFKFLASVYLSIMLLMFTNGGQLDVTLDGSAMGYDPSTGGLAGLDMTLKVQGIIYILSIIAFVKGFLAFTEFSDNRKEYLRDLAEKFNRKDEKKAKKVAENTLAYDEDDDEPATATSDAKEMPEEAPAEEATEEPAEAENAEAEEQPDEPPSEDESEEAPEEKAAEAEPAEAEEAEPEEQPAEPPSEDGSEEAPEEDGETPKKKWGFRKK